MHIPMMHHPSRNRFMDFSGDLSHMRDVPLPVTIAVAVSSLTVGAGMGMIVGHMKSKKSGFNEVRSRLEEMADTGEHHHHGDGKSRCNCQEGAHESQQEAGKHKHH